MAHTVDGGSSFVDVVGLQVDAAVGVDGSAAFAYHLHFLLLDPDEYAGL